MGLNYADHAAKAGLKAPGPLIVFKKPNGAISGPIDDIWLAPGSEKPGWGVELGMVIGRRGKGRRDPTHCPMPTCAVSGLSRFMAQVPGDVIASGTPPGVAMGMKPPDCLREGGAVTLGAPGLGEPRQRVVPSPAG